MKLQHLFANKKYRQFVLTMVTALIGGTSFMMMQLPIPWLLGPMISILIASNVWKAHYGLPRQVRDIGLARSSWVTRARRKMLAEKDHKKQLTQP